MIPGHHVTELYPTGQVRHEMSEEYPQLTVMFVAQGLIRFRSMVQLIVGSAACRLSHSTSETLPQHSKATAGTDEAFPGIGLPLLDSQHLQSWRESRNARVGQGVWATGHKNHFKRQSGSIWGLHEIFCLVFLILGFFFITDLGVMRYDKCPWD